MFSLFAASIGVPRVVAFEPFHKNADLLRASIATNGFDGGHNKGRPEITLFNLAASASTHAVVAFKHQKQPPKSTTKSNQ